VIFFGFAFAACAIAWRRRASHPDWMQLVLTCVVFYVVNAIVCGVLASVENRYQSRVSWPLAFAGIVLIASVLRGRVAAAPAMRTRRILSPPQ
jgi:branched-subunit amino acid transport protein